MWKVLLQPNGGGPGGGSGLGRDRVGIGSACACLVRSWFGIGSGSGRDWVARFGLGSQLVRDRFGIGSGLVRDTVCVHPTAPEEPKSGLSPLIMIFSKFSKIILTLGLQLWEKGDPRQKCG